MKFLKALLLIVGLLFGVYAIMCALGPSSSDTSQTTVIDASPSSIYAEISDFKQWPNWSPWEGIDETMVTTYDGADAGVGAQMNWTSAKAGNGGMEIIEAVENTSIKKTLSFADAEGNSMGAGHTNWTLKEVEGGTEVTWDMVGFDLPFLIRGMIMIGGQSVEEDYKKGLAQLKTYVESKPKFTPMSEEMSDVWVISVQRDNVTEEDLANGAVHGPAYGMIATFMAEREMAEAGMPICISRGYEDGVMDLSMSIPVADSVEVPEGMIMEKIPGGKCLSTIHKGPYEGITSTWEMMEAYMKENPQEMRYFPYEVYVNDPSTVAPEDIETKIVYPVEG
ncbi:MAG: SRPBCC family protein [Flavobacteriales bacterium]|nr:SRPBCC family protein [Flavobacteriales bacterium]